MASPRIFVSSTFYDLRYVRADLEHFERESGCELVFFERANVPYDGSQTLERSCLDEIEKCDIVVSLIGGRTGTLSQEVSGISISRREVEHAVNLGRQLFVFVERAVYDEFETYAKNVNNALNINWRFVDSVRVFEFIAYVRELPLNNAVFPFDTSQTLMARLRDQLAGLFQALLQQQRRGRFDANVNKLVESVETLKRVIDYLGEAKVAESRVMDDILLSRHPAFKEVQLALDLKIRVIFEDLEEAEAVFSAAGFRRVDEKELSPADSANFFFWAGAVGGRRRRVGLRRTLFTSVDSSDGIRQVLNRKAEAASGEFVVVQ